MSKSKSKPEAQLGVLFTQEELDDFDLMIQEIPWKYANPLLAYLQSKVKLGGYFLRVEPTQKSSNLNNRAFTFREDDEFFDYKKTDEHGLPISRPQQQVQNY